MQSTAASNLYEQEARHARMARDAAPPGPEGDEARRAWDRAYMASYVASRHVLLATRHRQRAAAYQQMAAVLAARPIRRGMRLSDELGPGDAEFWRQHSLRQTRHAQAHDRAIEGAAIEAGRHRRSAGEAEAAAAKQDGPNKVEPARSRARSEPEQESA